MRVSRWSPAPFALSLVACGGWATGLGAGGDGLLGQDATLADTRVEDTSTWTTGDSGTDTRARDTSPDTTTIEDGEADALPEVLPDAPPYDGAPKAIGTTCSADAECLYKHCVDGVCCESTCATTCWACNGAGTAGYCRVVANGGTDPGSCEGSHICNGGGACVGAIGQPCTSAAQCTTPYCVDGVCCDSVCAGICQACNVAGHIGACSPVPAGQHDDYPAAICTGAYACSGSGTCLRPNGIGCSADSQCISGACADGFCCDTACNGACLSCSLAGTIGTCKPIPKGQIDVNPACSGIHACDGNGACLLAIGQTCSGPTECASGNCGSTSRCQ
jgi:hypothetical protein